MVPILILITNDYPSPTDRRWMDGMWNVVASGLLPAGLGFIIVGL
jgi:hypothetical protein